MNDIDNKENTVLGVIQKWIEERQEKKRAEKEEENRKYRESLKSLVLIYWLEYLKKCKNFQIYQGNSVDIVMRCDEYCVMPNIHLQMNRKVFQLYEGFCKICMEDFEKYLVSEVRNYGQMQMQIENKGNLLQNEIVDENVNIQRLQETCCILTDRLKQDQCNVQIRKCKIHIMNLQNQWNVYSNQYQQCENKIQELKKTIEGIHLGIRPVKIEYNHQPANKLLILKLNE